jgi:hypothetical protein
MSYTSFTNQIKKLVSKASKKNNYQIILLVIGLIIGLILIIFIIIQLEKERTKIKISANEAEIELEEEKKKEEKYINKNPNDDNKADDDNKTDDDNKAIEQFTNKNDNIKEDFQDVKYKKCDRLAVRGIMKDIFDKNDVVKNTETNEKNKWDLYIPCGYNNVETELQTIKPTNESQAIFGISGCDKIVSKNNIWQLLEEKYGREKASNIMPETFILSDKQQIEKLKENYKKKQQNNKPIKYILKKNVQRKEGLMLSSDLNEILSAHKQGYKVAQSYLNDIFLINKRKLNLRIYVLIKCQNGMVNTYVHKEGKCIYTNKDYDGDDNDFEKNITSVNLDLAIYDKNPMTLDDLHKYFIQHKYNYEVFFEKILDVIRLAMNATKHDLCNLSNIKNNVSFQLFGADVILDKNLKPYLLEFNKGPDMTPKNDTDKNIKTKVEEDMFDLVNIIKKNNNQFIIL